MELLLDDDSPFFFPKKGIRKNISLCSYGNRKILNRDVTIGSESRRRTKSDAEERGHPHTLLAEYREANHPQGSRQSVFSFRSCWYHARNIPSLPGKRVKLPGRDP